jgi:AAA15 family ATPase/GTPase
MITRIKINGFKSLVQTDLYLGPFTCIAGANAIGKSNFFDALSFLSKLADKTIQIQFLRLKMPKSRQTD